MEPFANHHDNDSCEQEETQDEEEPEEPLGIMPKTQFIQKVVFIFQMFLWFIS